MVQLMSRQVVIILGMFSSSHKKIIGSGAVCHVYPDYHVYMTNLERYFESIEKLGRYMLFTTNT